jgi:septal ring-binding cell division protein DamX
MAPWVRTTGSIGKHLRLIFQAVIISDGWPATCSRAPEAAADLKLGMGQSPGGPANQPKRSCAKTHPSTVSKNRHALKLVGSAQPGSAQPIDSRQRVLVQLPYSWQTCKPALRGNKAQVAYSGFMPSKAARSGFNRSSSRCGVNCGLRPFCVAKRSSKLPTATFAKPHVAGCPDAG